MLLRLLMLLRLFTFDWLLHRLLDKFVMLFDKLFGILFGMLFDRWLAILLLDRWLADSPPLPTPIAVSRVEIVFKLDCVSELFELAALR